MEFEDNIAVVTGGGSGIGANTAIKLASLGAKVAILDRDQDAVTTMATRTNGIGVVCDVRDEQSSQDAIAFVYERLGLPRICVNCAGIGGASRIVGREGPHPLALFEEIIAVNLVGTFNIMRLVAELMLQLEPLEDNERGVIINTASVAAFEGQIGQAAYSASKGGVVALTLPAAREFAQFGIRVNTIAPGPVATPLMEGATDKIKDALLAQVQFPKRFAEPDEFSSLVAHIVENVAINGETIRMDCGVRMT